MTRWAELFDVNVHQKRLSDTEKMQYLKFSRTGQAKAVISGFGSFHSHFLKPGTLSAKSLADPDSESNLNARRYTHNLMLDTTTPVALFVL